MKMWKCDKCGEYRFDSVPKCNCKPFTIIDEDGEKYNEIYAIDEEDAALKYAEKSNTNGDYYLMDTDSVIITVNDKKFEISAEPDIYYSAKEVKNE